MKVDPALAGFDLSVYQNQGEDIIKRLDNLIDNGKLGARPRGLRPLLLPPPISHDHGHLPGRPPSACSWPSPPCTSPARTLTFGHSIQGAVNFKSFGMVLIGGMTSATLFTLLAVPVFYHPHRRRQERLQQHPGERFHSIFQGGNRGMTTGVR